MPTDELNAQLQAAASSLPVFSLHFHSCFVFVVFFLPVQEMGRTRWISVQLGKIMNEVDRGWQRPSLKCNGSQQRDGDIDPSVTPPPPLHLLPIQTLPLFVHTHIHCRPVYTLITQCERAHTRTHFNSL